MRVELTLAAGPGELEGERSVETKHGIAVFDDVELDHAGSGYVLRATVPGEAGVAAAESRAFTVEEEDD